MPPAPATSSRFLWSIDILRFVFALMVACGHAYGFAGLYDDGWRVGFFERVEHGGLWVAGFFVLSGWCIAAGDSGRREAGVKRFLAARLTRILPLYVIFLLATVVAEAVFSAVGGRTQEIWDVRPWNLLPQLTMTQGLLGVYGAYNASWSLNHELICYAAWAGIVALLGRHGGWRRVFLLAMVPLVLAAGIHKVVHDDLSYRLLSVPLFLFIWLIGAFAVDLGDRFGATTRNRISIVAVLAALPPMIWYALDLRFPETAAVVAFSVLLGVALIWLSRLSVGGPRLERISRWLGLASYPLYLSHGIVLVGVAVIQAHVAGPHDPVRYMLVAVSVAVAFALVIGVPLEQRTLAWRSAWLRRHFPHPATGPREVGAATDGGL